MHAHWKLSQTEQRVPIQIITKFTADFKALFNFKSHRNSDSVSPIY